MSTHLVDGLKFCPHCGGQHIEDAGAVFVEDGPWTGKSYANEGEYTRLKCTDCGLHFGALPEPMLCKCGELVYGEVGEECDDDPEHEGQYLCETCMKEVARA